MQLYHFFVNAPFCRISFFHPKHSQEILLVIETKLKIKSANKTHQDAISIQRSVFCQNIEYVHKISSIYLRTVINKNNNSIDIDLQMAAVGNETRNWVARCGLKLGRKSIEHARTKIRSLPFFRVLESYTCNEKIVQGFNPQFGVGNYTLTSLAHFFHFSIPKR